MYTILTSVIEAISNFQVGRNVITELIIPDEALRFSPRPWALAFSSCLLTWIGLDAGYAGGGHVLWLKSRSTWLSTARVFPGRFPLVSIAGMSLYCTYNAEILSPVFKLKITMAPPVAPSLKA